MYSTLSSLRWNKNETMMIIIAYKCMCWKEQLGLPQMAQAHCVDPLNPLSSKHTEPVLFLKLQFKQVSREAQMFSINSNFYIHWLATFYLALSCPWVGPGQHSPYLPVTPAGQDRSVWQSHPEQTDTFRSPFQFHGTVNGLSTAAVAILPRS